jgi:hypothetical protein
MNYRIAGTDVDVEFFERNTPVVLEVLLNLHLYIVAREVSAELIAIGAELIGNDGKEYLDRQCSTHAEIG